MRQVPLERDINIAVNGCSGFATSTQKGPFMAMLISCSRGTCLIRGAQAEGLCILKTLGAFKKELSCLCSAIPTDLRRNLSDACSSAAENFLLSFVSLSCDLPISTEHACSSLAEVVKEGVLWA